MLLQVLQVITSFSFRCVLVTVSHQSPELLPAPVRAPVSPTRSSTSGVGNEICGGHRALAVSGSGEGPRRKDKGGQWLPACDSLGSPGSLRRLVGAASKISETRALTTTPLPERMSCLEC